MEKSTLLPFLRPGLDILFVGLNPAVGSSRNGHYFSVNQAFWDQLYESGLTTKRVDKRDADTIVFGSNSINTNGWQYGITDLVTAVAESDSRAVKPTGADCARLVRDVSQCSPRAVIILHSKVRNRLRRFLHQPLGAREGRLERFLSGVHSEFFAVPFPHGNAIPKERKVDLYKQVAAYLVAKGTNRILQPLAPNSRRDGTCV